MKKFKVMLSVFMVLVIISISITPSLAIVISEDSVIPKITWRDKISYNVFEKMEQIPDDEKIAVWVWFKDVDKSDVESMVKKETGLTKNDLSVYSDVSSDNLVSALEMASNKNTDIFYNEANHEIEMYLERTKESRARERELTNKYLKAKRNIVSDLYVDNNNRIVNKLGINAKDIDFQSKLTPSMIARLNKEEIFEIANDNNVVKINYYDTTQYEPPSYEIEKDTLQVDAITNMYNFSGLGVNILMNDHGFVRSDLDYYDAIANPNLIQNVYNKSLHSTTNINILPIDGYKTEDHPNQVASVLHSYAENSSIYSTSHGDLENIEWAMLNCDIDLINASVNYNNNPTNYLLDPGAQWFDALVSDYDVPLIASAGNFRTSTVSCITPACGYNTIAVGAYSALTDTMIEFKYAPIDSEDIPCYKPDVVIPAGSTSYAAPTLSGIVALILEAKPSLKSHPEVVKAIIMSSCHRKVQPAKPDEIEYIESGLTQRQGAGAVDAYRALKIAIEGTYGENTIVSQGESTVRRFTVDQPDDVNVSIAWSRENHNSYLEQTNGDPITSLGIVQELELRVYNGTEVVGLSDTVNSGKQMVYLKNLSPNNPYRITVNKSTNNNIAITYGYAWSSKEYEQAELEFTGKLAVGQNLTANATYIDGHIISDDQISYEWQSSNDGVNWQKIENINTKSYTLTSNDWKKYLKCIATISNTPLSDSINVSTESNIKIIIYGDVDMDGVVSNIDSTAIQRYLINLEELSDEKLYAADVDGDGTVTTDDVRCIQQYVAGIITLFPVEQQ